MYNIFFSRSGNVVLYLFTWISLSPLVSKTGNLILALMTLWIYFLWNQVMYQFIFIIWFKNMKYKKMSDYLTILETMTMAAIPSNWSWSRVTVHVVKQRSTSTTAKDKLRVLNPFIVATSAIQSTRMYLIRVGKM